MIFLNPDNLYAKIVPKHKTDIVTDLDVSHLFSCFVAAKINTKKRSLCQ